ncbi:restriction endonuclease subunit S [Megamonas funiformis]|uniref:restriction endonuclease subunit S n=1 Tax=Megamonas funiformis TaxID=437897 RepID=UPI0022DEC2CA|nr:restriction endonuclease subunit S [Megamonas funiformis]
MLADKLRKSVLQSAIQGKLTEQLATDDKVEDLLQAIKEEKELLIKEKKIKKQKPLPEITEDEIPFAIPENWKWVRISDISNSVQYGVNTSAKSHGKIRLVRISDIQNNEIIWENVPYCDEDESILDLYGLKNDDILFARTGGTVGKSVIAKNVLPNTVFAGYLIRLNYNRLINSSYLKYFMESNLYWKQITKGTTITAQPNCNGQTLFKMIIPLPPLAEQKRIVEKLDNVLANIDKLKDNEEKLSILQKNFPDKLKKSILQSAIQGKLTEQLAIDDNVEDLLQAIKEEKERLIKEKKIKKQKSLPEITEEEIPFAIPENWKWIRLGEIVSILGDGLHGTPIYDESGEYYFINGNNLLEEKIIIKSTTKKVSQIEYEKYKKNLNKDTMLVSINGTIGNVAFYDNEKVMLGKSVCYFNLLKNVNKKYLKYIFYSVYFIKYVNKMATGSTIKNLSLKAMNLFIIPLPPLAEQKRIVEKLDKLLADIEELKIE